MVGTGSLSTALSPRFLLSGSSKLLLLHFLIEAVREHSSSCSGCDEVMLNVQARKRQKDKFVIVSIYTGLLKVCLGPLSLLSQVMSDEHPGLQVIEAWCKLVGHPCLVLDGSTDVSKRTEIVCSSFLSCRGCM